MKQCKNCKETKIVSAFYKRSSNKDGLRNWCKDCDKKSSKKWRKKKADHIKGYNKKYKSNHKEEIAIYLEENKDIITRKRAERAPLMKSYFKKRYEEIKDVPEYRAKKQKNRLEFKDINPSYFKNYYQKNTNQLKEKASIRYQEKSEEIKEYVRGYSRRNRSKINKRLKERKANNPEFKLICNLRSYFNQSIKGNYKTGNIVELLGMTIPEFKIYLEDKFEDWMNWDNRGLYNGEFNHGWDIDHVKPLSAFDFSIPEEIAQAWHYSNLQPLCSKVNREIKRDKY